MLKNHPPTVINLDDLSMDQLIDLNKRVVRRLKDLNTQQQTQAAAQFRIGDIVSFLDTDHKKVVGFIVSIQKTKINILSETGNKWSVSPVLLSPEEKPSKALLKLLESFIPHQFQGKICPKAGEIS